MPTLKLQEAEQPAVMKQAPGFCPLALRISDSKKGGILAWAADDGQDAVDALAKAPAGSVHASAYLFMLTWQALGFGISGWPQSEFRMPAVCRD